MSKASKAIKIIELNEYVSFDEYQYLSQQDQPDNKEDLDKCIKNILKRTGKNKQKIIKELNKFSLQCEKFKDLHILRRDEWEGAADGYLQRIETHINISQYLFFNLLDYLRQINN